MKMYKLLTIILAVGLLQACNGSKEKTTPSGLTYTIITEGSGEVVPTNHYLMLNMMYKDDTDSVWVDTNDRGIPIMIYKEDSVWTKNDGSVQEIFINLTKGDSITFNVTANDLFTKTWTAPLPANVKPETIISFFIGVEDVLNEEGLREWQQQMMAKQEAKMNLEAEGKLKEDIATIDAYLAENNITAQTTESGLRYVITQEGTGDNAQVGQSVKVDYAGYVLNGEYFDSSIKEIAIEKGIYNKEREAYSPYEPYEFVLGQGVVIQGWDEGITLLNVGSKATFYIPSGLAYGPRARSPKIPANSILVFDLELVEAN